MGKRTYRSRSVKAVDVEKLGLEAGEKVTLALDIAKEEQYAVLLNGAGEPAARFRWSHPEETTAFLALCEAVLARGVTLDAVMEPTGTYGDAIRAKLRQAGIEVFRVNGKQTKDSAEIRDRVPSLHDAKAADIIGWLHRQGASELWRVRTERERDLVAYRDLLEISQAQVMAMTNRLEAKLARHWPELTGALSLTSATLVALLKAYGCPAAVALYQAEARCLMKKVGRSFLQEETIAAVLDSAGRTLGEPMTKGEVECVRKIAAELDRARSESDELNARLQELASELAPKEASDFIGPAVTTALIAYNAAPTGFKSAGSFQKALGVNLRYYSSGASKKPTPHISKRGPSVPRQLLFMAALRFVKQEPLARAWYQAKVKRSGEGKHGTKALVALMRKLANALWHVWTKKEPFDPRLLFNASKLTEQAQTAKAS